MKHNVRTGLGSSVAVASLVVGFYLSSCTSNEVAPGAKPNSIPQTLPISKQTNFHSSSNQSEQLPPFPVTGGPGIYIAGVGQNPSGVAVATFWKNDTIVNLSNSQSYAYSIAVSGNDIYVA